MKMLQAFLDNDSAFGRIMGRCGFLIAGNLLFLLFSLPIVTIGAAWTALYYTNLKSLRTKDGVSAISAFWTGFRDNWKQATAAFLVLFSLTCILSLELFWCSQFTGVVALFRCGLLSLLFVILSIAVYIFPVIAVFHGNLRQLFLNSVIFAIRRPVTLVLVLFAHAAPLAVTFMDRTRMPLYAFLWCLIGFSGISMFCGIQMMKQFVIYLPNSDETSGS